VKVRGDSPNLAKARKRVAKLGTPPLLDWAENTVTAMGRSFSDYRREEAVESLVELRDEALPAMIALVDELILRYEASR
jgi:hypothetical protein